VGDHSIDGVHAECRQGWNRARRKEDKSASGDGKLCHLLQFRRVESQNDVLSQHACRDEFSDSVLRPVLFHSNLSVSKAQVQSDAIQAFTPHPPQAEEQVVVRLFVEEANDFLSRKGLTPHELSAFSNYLFDHFAMAR
jgi:hypothetical protein